MSSPPSVQLGKKHPRSDSPPLANNNASDDEEMSTRNNNSKKSKKGGNNTTESSSSSSSSSSSTRLTRRPSLTRSNSQSNLKTGGLSSPQSYSEKSKERWNFFKEFSEGQGKKTDVILHQVLPKKVLELDKLAQTFPVFAHDVEFPYSADGKLRPGAEKEPIPENKKVKEMMPLLKTHCVFLLENTYDLKLFIQLRIPAYDDGNNFGVEIQEEIINEISRVEDLIYSFLEKHQNYINVRARLISKICKYPAIQDFWQAVRELDEHVFTELRMQTIEIRNCYAMMFDLLQKNEEKIKDPRGEAHKPAQSSMI